MRRACSRTRIAARRWRQAEILTQRRVFVGSAKQPAPLQLRDHECDEILAAAGQIGRLDIEPVRGAGGEPFLHHVGDLCRSADHTEAPEPGGDDVEHLPQRQFFPRDAFHQRLRDRRLARTGLQPGLHEVALHRHVRQHVIEPVVTQIREMVDHQHAAADILVQVFLEAVELVLRLLLRAANERHDARHHLQIIPVAPVFRQAVLGRGVVAARRLDGGLAAIHQVGVARRELLRVLRGSGGDDRQAALRRSRRVQRPAHGEMLADVIEAVEFRLVDIQAARLVADEGVVVPAVPQAARHIDELDGAFVPRGRIERRVEPVVARLVRAPAGHHVPAGAAAADMIERGHAPREIIRMVVGRRRRRHHADMRRHRGDR